MIRIADVVEPRVEKVLPQDHPDLPFIGLDDVEAHTMHLLGEKSASEMKSAAKRFYSGDVLYSRLRPYLNKVWCATHEGMCSSEFIVLPGNDYIDPKFLTLRLNALDFVSFANSLNAGDRPRVDFDQISSFFLPSFSLHHQRRIVSKIEELFSELDKGIESLKTAREQLKIYRQAVLKHAFEGKLIAEWRKQRSRGHWEETSLDSLLSYLTSGSRGWAKYYSDDGDIFIRAQNLKHDRLDLDDIAYVQLPEKSEGMRTRVQVGDLLITITGANVTKTAYVHKDFGNAYVSQHVALCRPKAIADTEFLYWYLIGESAGRKQLKELAYGAGKPGLNLDNIRSIKIQLPELDEQKVIVQKINELLSIEASLTSAIESEIQRAESLRQSILKKAFSGRLVPQDPNDEPASVLLERIRVEQAKTPSPKRSRTKRPAVAE